VVFRPGPSLSADDVARLARDAAPRGVSHASLSANVKLTAARREVRVPVSGAQPNDAHAIAV